MGPQRVGHDLVTKQQQRWLESVGGGVQVQRQLAMGKEAAGDLQKGRFQS